MREGIHAQRVCLKPSSNRVWDVLLGLFETDALWRASVG